MKRKHTRIVIIIGFLFLAALFMHIYVHNKNYNKRTHLLIFNSSVEQAGMVADENISVTFHIRGYGTSELATWKYLYREKGDEDTEYQCLIGSIYELNIKNISKYVLSDWQADIYVPEDIYFNSGWNGDFTIHQHVSTDEKAQTFYRGKIDIKDIRLDYKNDGACPLVKLDAGDYINYVPAMESQEYPILGANLKYDEFYDKTVGFIFYMPTEDLNKVLMFGQGRVVYKMYRELWKEPLFVIFMVLSVLWFVALLSKILAETLSAVLNS